MSHLHGKSTEHYYYDPKVSTYARNPSTREVWVARVRCILGGLGSGCQRDSSVYVVPSGSTARSTRIMFPGRLVKYHLYWSLEFFRRPAPSEFPENMW